MSQQKPNDINDTTSPLNPKEPASTSSNTIKENEPKPTANQVEKESFSDRWKNNRFWLVRGSYHFLRTVWLIVMAVGGFIAWLISLLFI